MPRPVACAVGRMWQAICILVALAASGIGATQANSQPVGQPTDGKPPTANGGNASTAQAPRLSEKPLWTDLKPAQQQALAPLSSEWNSLDTSQKKKWLEISSRYATLKPDQQVRLQDRMRDWVKLSPAERRVARESYSRTKKLAPDQKAAEWQQYQQLSEDQKKKLLDDVKTRKRITNLPPASQAKGKLIPPPKSARDANAGQSVEPTSGNQPAKPESQPPLAK